MESKKKKVPNLLCATQGEDDGMMSISFYYGLEGMGKHTPIKALFPAIGDIADAFEDIKVHTLNFVYFYQYCFMFSCALESISDGD